MPGDDAHRAIQAVFQIEWPRLVAWLARLTRDVGLTEELAQDALVAALEAWPSTGVPERPGAWGLAHGHGQEPGPGSLAARAAARRPARGERPRPGRALNQSC